MQEQFKLYIDRLRRGDIEQLDFQVDPSFLDVKEKELQFNDPIKVWGEAYLADSELIIKLKLNTFAHMICSICNGPVVYPININMLYVTKPLSEITSHIFDFSAEVREAILLEVPFIVECNGGKCPERKEIAKFLAPPSHSLDASGDQSGEADGWQPFKDL